jgi:dTDP-glucose pyrophosphorylase
MKPLESFLIGGETSVRDAIAVIDRGAVRLALVVDGAGTLLGTVTDGDIRRGLLTGRNLEDRIEELMHRNFRFLGPDGTKDDALKLMQTESLHQIPVIDADGRLLDLFLLDEILRPTSLPNWVVLMAGGEGKRLYPVTETIPKPMVRIGDRPLLQIILERCIEAGFAKVFISVNYRRSQILEHFEDGVKWGIDIEYLEESEPLGTAGALALLPTKPAHPVVIINGDVLTRVDLPALLRFHSENRAALTMCVRAHDTQIPFGVVQTDGIRFVGLEEKPVLTHYVNSGIYVVNPSILEELSSVGSIDMTELIDQAMGSGHSVAVFPIHEYWLDVGSTASLEQAQGDWL